MIRGSIGTRPVDQQQSFIAIRWVEFCATGNQPIFRSSRRRRQSQYPKALGLIIPESFRFEPTK
jgi:hypothetical protein